MTVTKDAVKANTNLFVYSRDMLEEREYWLKKLSLNKQFSHLTLDYDRPRVFSAETDTFDLALSGDILDQLTKLTSGSDFLTYTVLLTALNLCLRKETGSSIISVGSPTRKRDEGNVWDNALVIVNNLEEHFTVKQLLLNVRETLLEAYARQRFPFVRLLQDLGIDQVTNKCPLFDVALVFRPIHRLLPEVKNDLTITFTMGQGRLLGTAEFRTSVLAKSSVSRLCDSFLQIFKQILEDTSAPMLTLCSLTSVEREHLVARWNTTPSPYPDTITLPMLFESQALRTPDAVAISSSSGHLLTYSRLNASSSHMARLLRSRGVCSESPVVLLCGRSPETVLCLLAVLKAGAFYVPLEATLPARRLRTVLEDLGRPKLLATVPVPEDLSGHCCEALQADDLCCGFTSESDSGSLPQGVVADNLAYVIYTSGSTGAPKGVMVTHRGACNLVLAQTEAFGVGTTSRILQVASLSFDASVSELFTALCSGACLCLAQREQLIPGEPLLRSIVEQTITTVTLPPSTLRAMPKTELECLETLVSAGEACTQELIEKWVVDGQLLLNAYGPTEVSVCATISSRLNSGRGRAPIGRPIRNTTAYVVGHKGELMPAGAVGELYVGGEGVARGYLGKPELTAERFAPDPFSSKVGERLYNTGDLCRLGVNGELEYLGRTDQQVKVRGYRVELGEVEQVLRKQIGVKEAVVVARRRAEASEIELVGWVVLEDDDRQSAKELRRQLAKELSEFMLPAKLIEVKSVPVSENGKVDRRRLVQEWEKWEEVGAEKVARKEHEVYGWTPVEEVIEGVWCEVLGLERVEEEENFFDLGGHSLLATQVVSRIGELLGALVPLSDVFESANLRELTNRVEAIMRKGQSLQSPPIVPIERSLPQPLSFAQQRLWFLDRMNPNKAAYNIATSFRIEGRLNASILEQSFNEIVRRHEVLRTYFPSRGSQPLQVILPSLNLTLPIEDLSAFSPEEGEKKVRQRLSEVALTPFDLARAPLMRVCLLRLSGEKYVLIVVMHHIITDGWSLNIFIREMVSLYEAFSNELASPLPEMTIQYADFTHWQRQWLDKETLETHLSYWRRQLDGAPALLRLPTDRQRPAVRTFDGARYSLRFPLNLREKLRVMSRREGVTLFMTLLAGFKALLFRYTGQEDIVVGSPTANRQKVETENLIGFFVNTLVLRTDLSNNPCVRELLRRVRQMALGAYAHQDIPFERLVDELRVERDVSHTPLFQVWFALQNTQASVLRLPGLTFEAMGFDNKSAQFDLTLSLVESEGGLDILFEYSTCLFDPTTIINLAGHFQTLLDGMVADPEQPLTSLPLLSEAQRQQLFIEWNDTFELHPPQGCLHQLFEAQARNTPCAVALDCEEGHITYAELDWRANQLARQLREKGVCAEALVALFLLPGIELVVAILGVLKAGGAYLPLDPAYPKGHLGWMLRDAGATIILAQRLVIKGLPDCLPEVLCLDAEWPLIALQREDRVTSETLPDNLAYVIYTSGSTDTPRGVMVTHRGACNLVSAQIKAFRLGPASRVLQFASPSFDASVSELFTALCSGACLRLATKAQLLPGEPLLRLIEEYSITTLTLPPSALRTMPTSKFLCLETLVSAGEACTPELVAKWSVGERIFLNAYGPTEVSVCATISSGLRGGSLQVPIGRPIHNTRVYVLGRRGELLPRGVVGELGVGGEGVSRGYLRRPEQTAERFVPDPMSAEGGARIYLSGDLCRLGSEGELEFIARADQQVKVRGYRVEPAEIEKALESHGQVKEAVVIACEDSESGVCLVAYVVPVMGAMLGGMTLRAFLKQRAPEFMIPSIFVLVDSLPLSPNGKVDRQRLPKPNRTREDLETSYVEPQTKIEMAIMLVWQQVLQIEKIGIHDNFFDLGGHSLQMVQAHDRLKELFQLDLSIIELFTYPTIKSLSDYLSQSRSLAPSLQPSYDRAELRKATLGMRKHIRNATGPELRK